MKKFTVDHSDTASTIEEIKDANEDCPLTEEELQMLEELQVGEFIYIGFVEVKRVQ